MKEQITDILKFKGVFPAFYACYDHDGNVSEEKTKQYARFSRSWSSWCLSDGKFRRMCILNKEERKLIMRAVTEER